MLTTSHLLCEYAENPLAVDTHKPRLSWQLQAEKRGVRQTAYQLLVASTCEGLEAGKPDLWDSGKVESPEQMVEYAGRPLGSRQVCWWQVRVWDQNGEGGAFSSPAYFEMSLAPEDWHAEWIGNPGGWINRALYFRREFNIENPVRRARVYMAGLGWSELYINGQRANNRVMDPAQSDYSRRILYTTDAVEGLLHEGKNAIGVVVGNGWYGTVRLLLQLEIEFADGSSQQIISRGSWLEPWLVTAGPILENSVYDGEVYDARLEIADWCEAGYAEGQSAWIPAFGADGPGGKLVPAQLEPIRVVDTLRAQNIHQPKLGVYVFDLGQNIAGWALLKVNGAAGQRVSLRFAESLYPDGTVNQENLRAIKAEDVYILKGGGEEIWEPRFTYHGFRYIQVEGYPGEPGPEAVQGRVVRSEVEAVGTFECSNELINRIQRMIWWTESSNLHSIPTDCPQRNERMGWLNDLAARSEEVIYNFDLARFFAKFIGDIADAQDSNTGAISDTAPFRWGRRPADPVSVCYLLIPWLLYTHHGDRRTMAEYYDGMKRWVNYLTSRAEGNILSYSYYADWAPPVSEISTESPGGLCVARETPGALISTACYAYSARLLSKIAKVLGKKRDAAAYLRLSKQVSEAYNSRFWNEKAAGYGSSNQACNAISLYMGLVPAQRRKNVEASLVRDVQSHDNHLNTGNICTKYLLEALSAAGYSDIAYTIARQESYPSWGYMLANGATTLWERWEHATGGGMNSHNHPMMGSVGAWFYRILAGIQANEGGPGFSSFSIRPEIVPDLNWVRSTVRTVRGQVKLEWTRTDDGLDISVQVPYGSMANIVIPGPIQCAISESGTLVWENAQSVALPEGISSAQWEKEGVIFSLGGGVYNFRSRF
jgi:alpha-L-rhamnosidase